MSHGVDWYWNRNGHEAGVLGGDDQVHGGGDHPAAVDADALDGGEGRLGQVAPAQGVLDVPVPRALVHADHAAGVGPGLAVGELLGGADVVAGGPVLAAAEQDGDADVVVGHRLGEGGVEFLEQHPRLGVAVLRGGSW